MNPAVVISTFWSRRRPKVSTNPIEVYDHPFPIGDEGTLPRCLDSLRIVEGIGKIIIPVASDPTIGLRAEDQVRAIVERYPDLDILVVGPSEMGSIHRRLEQTGFGEMIDGVSLVGYSGVRNVGLVVAAILEYDHVIFIDDDTVIDDPQWLIRGMEGIGASVVGQAPMFAKTGYYTDASGAWAPKVESHWYDRWWRQTEAFNRWMRRALDGDRFQRSNVATGGCLGIHREIFSRVPFDPWITRGEDLDYVINLRMLGLDMIFDDQWRLKHLPPDHGIDEATRFKQDIFRWIYEVRKIEYARSQVDLIQVTSRSLEPYPGPFLEQSMTWRTIGTALLRSIGKRGARGYFGAAMTAMRAAGEYAQNNCHNYFTFARMWPHMMAAMWEDVALRSLLRGERIVDREALTGRFRPVGGHHGESAEPIDPFAPSGDVE